jgi:hypothetical protein
MKTALKKLSHAFATASVPADDTHFHAGPAGPYVCGDPRCVSPSLHPSDM